LSHTRVRTNANLGGKELAARLVMLGVPGNDGAFYHGTLLDHLVTHPIHETTMAAIDAKFSPALDAKFVERPVGGSRQHLR